jgi:hypothetical protein
MVFFFLIMTGLLNFLKSIQQIFHVLQMELRNCFYSSIMIRSPAGVKGSVKKQMSQSSSPSAARELWATPRGQVWNWPALAGTHFPLI